MSEKGEPQDTAEHKDFEMELTSIGAGVKATEPDLTIINKRLKRIDSGIFWTQLGIVVTIGLTVSSILLQYYKVI